MGIHSQTTPEIIQAIRNDVVVVDLDSNRVELPFPIKDLPEPESTILLNDLKKYFHLDILLLDSPSFNLNVNTSGEFR